MKTEPLATKLQCEVSNYVRAAREFDKTENDSAHIEQMEALRNIRELLDVDDEVQVSSLYEIINNGRSSVVGVQVGMLQIKLGTGGVV